MTIQCQNIPSQSDDIVFVNDLTFEESVNFVAGQPYCINFLVLQWLMVVVDSLDNCLGIATI